MNPILGGGNRHAQLIMCPRSQKLVSDGVKSKPSSLWRQARCPSHHVHTQELWSPIYLLHLIRMFMAMAFLLVLTRWEFSPYSEIFRAQGHNAHVMVNMYVCQGFTSYGPGARKHETLQQVMADGIIFSWGDRPQRRKTPQKPFAHCDRHEEWNHMVMR